MNYWSINAGRTYYFTNKKENSIKQQRRKGRKKSFPCTQLICQMFPLLHRNNPVILHVTFVSNQDHLCIVPGVSLDLCGPTAGEKRLLHSISCAKIQSCIKYETSPINTSITRLCWFQDKWPGLHTKQGCVIHSTVLLCHSLTLCDNKVSC